MVPALLTQGLVAQEADIHPRGLFETPQEGLYAQLPGTRQDPETWKDYFHLRLRASVSGETNVFLDDEDEGEQEDIIFTISPTLTFNTPSLFGEDSTLSEYVRPRFSVSYTPSYRIYSKNSENDGINHSFRLNFNNDAGFQITLPKTTISFDLGYDQSQGTTRFTDGFTESEQLYAGVRLNHRLSGKTNLNFGARASINNFDSDNLLDDVTYNFNASLMYQLSGKISIGPYVGYGISNVSGSADGLKNTQDRHSYSAGVRADYRASGKTTFTGSVGWSSYEFDGPGSGGLGTSGKGDDTITWRMGVNHSLSPKISLRASLWRSYKPSNNIVNTAYVATGASLTAAYRQSDQWNHYLTLTYENDDYFSDDPAGGSLNNDYYRITLGSRYRFNNGLSVGANISSSSQSSNESANDFDNWVFSLYADYVFW